MNLIDHRMLQKGHKNDRKQKVKFTKSLYFYMETKHRLKPNFFIAPHQDDSSINCRDCGHTMEKIPHTPIDKKPIYQCPRCNSIIPEQIYGLSDLK